MMVAWVGLVGLLAGCFVLGPQSAQAEALAKAGGENNQLVSALQLTQGDSALPPLPAVPRQCLTGATGYTADVVSLPNTLQAMRERKRIVVLAIGGVSIQQRDGQKGDYYELLESFLERVFKGIDVVIVNRGVSGELARDAAERMKNEVALAKPDLVLWQIGTADAMARIPIADFSGTTIEAAAWLKEQGIDLAIIGLRYAKALRHDTHYQEIRKALKKLADERGIMRFGRYEVGETIASLKSAEGSPADVRPTEISDSCMTEHLARAIAAGIYARQKRPPLAGGGDKGR